MKKIIRRLVNSVVMWFYPSSFGEKNTNYHFGTGRKNNIIYPVDGDAENHIRERLDDIFWKHHG